MNCVQPQGGRLDRASGRRTRSTTRGRGDRGVALVEFAIIAPLIFALLMGMFTGGLSMSRKNSMLNAVREGARLGATLNEDDAWGAAVQQKVADISGGDLTTSQVCVQLIRKATAATETVRKATPASCPFGGAPASTGVPVGECAVKVWAQRTSDLQVVFFSRTLTLTAASISRYEREGDPETCL